MDLKEIKNLGIASFTSAVFSAGSFYALTNFRLAKMEAEVNKTEVVKERIQEVRERLIRIETLLNEEKQRDNDKRRTDL